MPILKTAVRKAGRVAHAKERIELIDQLLASKKRIADRTDFVNLVNKRIERHGMAITASSLDKDIKYLKELIEPDGVTIDYSKAEGYRYSERGYSYFKNSVNDEDKNLLMLANSLFNVFNGTPLKEKFNVVINKVLAESLTGGPVLGLNEINHLQIAAAPVSQSNKWIPILLSAIHDKHALEIQYKGFGKAQKKKIICPYVLKQYNNRWYIVGYDYNCDRAQKTNVFALDGIQAIEHSNKKYLIDPDFNAEDYFRYSIGVWHWHDNQPTEVVLEFTKNMDLVQINPLHHSQKATLSKDGKVLTVALEVYNSPELEMIIHSFGSGVKVISPAALVQTMAASAQKVAALYK